MNASAGSILLIVAVILFLLATFGIAPLANIDLVSLGLAAFAGSFLVGRSWRR